MRLAVRDQSGSFVSADVALFPKGIQAADEDRRCAYRELKGLNHAVMMLVPAGAVSLGREGGGRRLKRRVVGDTQFPVGAQVLGVAISEIALDDGEQAFDLLEAPGGDEASCFEPIRSSSPESPRMTRCGSRRTVVTK